MICKKRNLNRALLLLTVLLLISIVPWASVSAYDLDMVHDTGDFKWVYDQVEYEKFTNGVPGGTRFQRITIFVGGEVGPSFMKNNLRYTIHIANDSNNRKAGRMFQWIDFFDENGNDWHVHLHHDGYHLNDGNPPLPHLADTPDLAYIQNNPELNLTQCVLNYTIIPPESKENSEGVKELTWSLIEHRAAFGLDENDEVDFAKNHTAKMKTTWHFYILNNETHIKQDLTVYDIEFTDSEKSLFDEGEGDFENATLVNYWHIGVWGKIGRPDAYEVDGTIYDSPCTLEAGNNVSIKFEGIELSQIDLGKEFRVNNLEDNNLTSRVRIEPENPDKPEDGLSICFDQQFPNLNYSSFENFTMDPEIVLPLNSAAGGLSVILIIAIASAVGGIGLAALIIVIVRRRR